MRVLLTGAAGELGQAVATRLAGADDVEELSGMDLAAPREARAHLPFVSVDPRDRHRVIRIVRELAPTAVVHLGVYEQDSEAPAWLAYERTVGNAVAVLGAAAEAGRLDRVVLRSGLEVYGRGRGSVMVPDEAVPPDPTTPFGKTLLEVEGIAAATGKGADVPVTVLRLAPLLGPLAESALARFLRLPVVPFSGLADPPFSVLHVDDAADAVVAALRRVPTGPINVVAPSAVTMAQAALIGRRLPVPLVGPEWELVRRVLRVAGVPVPRHLLELLHRGRTAIGLRAVGLLGLGGLPPTRQVVRQLYEWSPPVVAPPVVEPA